MAINYYEDEHLPIPVAKQYIKDFEQLGFGMFVHWGLYSQLGVGEWTYHIHNRKFEDYKKLFDSFTAEDFNAEELVLTAKAAGCKYIVLTTRHHEGFSLYDTCGLNEFDAPHSPAKRDLVREFVDACRKYDIVPFFYHETLDWYNDDFTKDFDKYLEYLRKSIEILCKNYGKIGGFWLDGNWSRPNNDWKEDELYKTIRKYQPEAMIINNMGLERRGEIGNIEIDSIVFEQGRPTPLERDGMPKYLAAEMCYTLNNHWGIATNDFTYKSPRELIESLCHCRKVGANFLLNIGPTGQGGIEPYQAELVKILGRWMNLYGEAIYNGRPCKADGVGENFALEDEENMYLFFYDWALLGNRNVTLGGSYHGAYVFGGVESKIESVEWMDNGEQLTFSQTDDMLTVNATGFPYGVNTCVRVAKAKKAK